MWPMEFESKLVARKLVDFIWDREAGIQHTLLNA